MKKEKKRVLGIVGSPRRKGNTHLFVSRILEAGDGGAATDLLFREDLQILECDGCHVCWKGNSCPKNDGMNGVYDKIANSDLLVFGTPVYWYGPTALMKSLIDRFVYFNCPENRDKIRGKRALLAVPFEEENPATADLLKGNRRMVTGAGGLCPEKLNQESGSCLSHGNPECIPAQAASTGYALTQFQ
jgi:multimeric flavodoxin WrbA